MDSAQTIRAVVFSNKETSLKSGAKRSLEDEPLRTERIRTLDQVRAFLDGSEPADFELADRTSAYAFVRRTLVRFG